MIKNLIMSGGGAKGIVYTSCLKVLDKYKLLEHLELIVGTSIGAIIGTLYNIGYNGKILEKLFTEINLQKILKISEDNLVDYFNVCGVINFKDSLMKIVKKFFKHKNINHNITFIELYEKTQIKLVITGTNLTTGSLEYFNYETTPNMGVILANEISACIPCYFIPIRYNNCIYVDGGVCENFPINYISNDDIKYTIGLYTDKDNYNNLNIENNIIDYIITIYESIKQKIITNEGYMIKLNPNIICLDFNICKEDKIKCFEYGTNYMLKYISMNMLDLL